MNGIVVVLGIFFFLIKKKYTNGIVRMRSSVIPSESASGWRWKYGDWVSQARPAMSSRGKAKGKMLSRKAVFLLIGLVMGSVIFFTTGFNEHTTKCIFKHVIPEIPVAPGDSERYYPESPTLKPQKMGHFMDLMHGTKAMDATREIPVVPAGIFSSITLQKNSGPRLAVRVPPRPRWIEHDHGG